MNHFSGFNIFQPTPFRHDDSKVWFTNSFICIWKPNNWFGNQREDPNNTKTSVKYWYLILAIWLYLSVKNRRLSSVYSFHSVCTVEKYLFRHLCFMSIKGTKIYFFYLSFYWLYLSQECGSVYLWNYQYITTGFLARNCHHHHDCLVSNVFRYFFLFKYFNFTFYFSSDVSVELLKLFSPLLLLLNQFCFDFSHWVEQCRQEPLQRWWDRSSSTSCGNWRGNSIIIWQSREQADRPQLCRYIM